MSQLSPLEKAKALLAAKQAAASQAASQAPAPAPVAQPVAQPTVQPTAPQLAIDPVYMELASQLDTLEQALLAAHPSMPTLLRQIHAGLLKNPAAIHSLDDDQIAVLISGLKSYTATEIIAKAPAKKKPAKENLTLDDL